MNPQEEIKARLEVAQLYEEMGQNPKAARYYLAAAEISLKAKYFDKGREFLEKVLALDPDNAQAKQYLERLAQHIESKGGGPARAANEKNQASGVGLTVPTPSVYLRKDQISAILSQVASAPNPKFFPFDPLPRVDSRAIEKKAEQLEAKREEARAKERTSVDSAFSRGPSSFGTGGGGGGFLNQVQRGGRSKRERAPESTEEKPRESGRRRGGGRGGSQDLADAIQKRLQGK